MPTARVHIDNLGGWAGYTRVYRLDPPHYFGAQLAEYVSICIVPGGRHADSEVMVVAATEQGVSVDGTMRRRAGSFVLDRTADTPDSIEGCFTQALTTLGYEIGGAS